LCSTTDPHKWHSSAKRLAGKATTRDLRVVKEYGTLLSTTEVNSFFVGICSTSLSATSSEIVSLIIEAEIDYVGGVSKFAVYKELRKLNRNCASYPGKLP